MKKVIVKAGFDATISQHRNIETRTHELIAMGPEITVSDGYHTFEELYDHRFALFIALCKKVNEEDEQAKSLGVFKEGFAFDHKGWIRKVWRSKLHADGTNHDGWFVLGIHKEKGKQLTYHLPYAKWDEVSFAEELEKAPEFDGHTPADVINRLKLL